MAGDHGSRQASRGGRHGIVRYTEQHDLRVAHIRVTAERITGIDTGLAQRRRQCQPDATAFHDSDPPKRRLYLHSRCRWNDFDHLDLSGTDTSSPRNDFIETT